MNDEFVGLKEVVLEGRLLRASRYSGGRSKNASNFFVCL
jgi:hypothetical protein